MPTLEVAPAWSAANAGDNGAPNAPNAPNTDTLTLWWERFDDPLLTRLVTRALAANTTVVSAQAAVRQAQALRDVASAALQPTLGSSASAQRATSGKNFGGSSGISGIDGIGGTSEASRSTGNQFQLGLDGKWTPDVFGAQRGGLNAAEAAATASVASLGDAQVKVASEVALNYILLRTSQQRLVIASNNLSNQQELLQITDWRQQAGLVTVLEVEQARAAAAQTQAALPLLKTSVGQTAHALAVLVGQSPAALHAELGVMPSALESSSSLESAPPLAGVPVSRSDIALSIPARVLRQRADVRATELQVTAALARVGQAEAQRWPSFSIGGTVGLSAISAAALTNGASVLGSVLASVSWPVLDGGASKAQVRVQQAAFEQAQETYRAAVLAAMKEVENALTALRGDRLRVASLGVAANAASNAALLARQRYSSGLIDFQIVLETQRNQFTTQDSVVSATLDVGSDQVRLFTALGGGWPLDSSMASNAADAQKAAQKAVAQ